jgi:hypothetical protein
LALEVRGLVAAARDPERLRAELEAAGLLRAEDAFELLRAEPAFELLRAAELELLRAAELELLRAAELELLRAEPDLELAAVAPLSLAAGRLRSPAFGEPLRFVLVCLATSRPLYASAREGSACVAHLAGVAWLYERLFVFGVTRLDRPAALELRIHFGAQQNHDVRDPQPDEEHDRPRECAIGLVVGAEVRHV